MAFAFVHSLVKHTLKYGGNALGGVLGGGVVPLPIGSIASAIYVDWCASCERDAKDRVPPADEQARMRTQLEKIVVTRQGRHRGIVELRYAHLEGNTPCLEYEYVDGLLCSVPPPAP